VYRTLKLFPCCGVAWQNFVNFPQEVAGGIVVPHWKAVDLDSAVKRGAALDTKVGPTGAGSRPVTGAGG
jgi:hypothetical protein